ncbi:MAG: curli assembly protein CsgG [Verrucomicrobia bacterium]|nr:curli assembly protein CsgG [Verrucomicrobiota bacterium]MCH8525886.1 CsgG/HfaB family protein [Kiritimatiellia bacterium]
MKKMIPCMHRLFLLWFCLGCGLAVRVAAEPVIPAAILPFNELGDGVKGEGPKVGVLLFAELIAQPHLYLVEREDLNKALQEQELNLSGLVGPGEAVRVGYLTGARILITGSLIESGNARFLVAKVIGTETSRVLGASVRGTRDSSTEGLTTELAEKIVTLLEERSGELLPKVVDPEDRIRTLVEALEGKELPALSIQITEEHIGRQIIDPAAETEVQRYALGAGFTVVEPGEKATYWLVGEAFSEFAVRRGNLISVKARVELKILDETNQVIAVDRQTRVAVDLAEHIAAKTALQEAAADLAERMLPRLAK